MAIRTIYINPNDVLKIRVIKDDELPKTFGEFWHQYDAKEHLLRIADNGDLRLCKALMHNVVID